MWRDIKDYEGLYEINENAVVRRVEGKRQVKCGNLRRAEPQTFYCKKSYLQPLYRKSCAGKKDNTEP